MVVLARLYRCALCSVRTMRVKSKTVCVLLLLCPLYAVAQTVYDPCTPSVLQYHSAGFSLRAGEQAAVRAAAVRQNRASRNDNCLRAGRWVGALSGSTMGILTIYWRATGVSGVHGPFWKSLVTGIPSALVGAYVGRRTTEWMTRQILKGDPGPSLALFKGALYGALNGAVILSSSMIPLFLIGHYTGTIEFNREVNAFKLVGISVLGGSLYGGVFGFAGGAIMGPCLSFYMHF